MRSRSRGFGGGKRTALLAVVLAALSRVATAECPPGGPFPCGYQVDDVQLAPAPGLLKFQARVSQAQLPIADGLFKKVYVNLKDGADTVCTEQFTDVRVVDTTVNLEVGRNTNCELAETIAAATNPAFQLCIGGQQTCLAPIPIGSAPYALKTTFAAFAAAAHRVDVAGQAQLAHRMSADGDLSKSHDLGTGSFDFHTPASASALYPAAADFTPYSKGGFLQWAPLRETAPTLHLAAKRESDGTPVPLTQLVVSATTTQAMGRLTVKSGGLTVRGPTNIAAASTISGPLTVAAPTSGPSGLVAAGGATMTGALTTTQAAAFSGGVSAAGGLVAGGATFITGDVTISGGTSATAASVTGGGVAITGPTRVAGNTGVTGNLSVTGAVVGGTANTTTLRPTALTIGSGGATVNGNLTVTGTVFLPSNAPISAVAGSFNVPGTLTAGTVSSQRITLANGQDFSLNTARPGAAGPIGGEVTSRATTGAGLLRVSAGGGTTAAARSFIDISGPSPTGATNNAISFQVGGSERLRAQGNTLSVTGNLTISGTVSATGGGLRPTYYVTRNCSTTPYYDPWMQTTLTTAVNCSCNSGDTMLNIGIADNDRNFIAWFINGSSGWAWCDWLNGPVNRGQHSNCVPNTANALCVTR